MIKPLKPEERTKPKPRGAGPEIDPNVLIAGRYGTDDTVNGFGAEKTFVYALRPQASSIKILSRFYPEYVPPEEAAVLIATANIPPINPTRIREIEAKKKHDIIAINTAWEEEVKKINPRAASHINKIRTSADTSETAKMLQLMNGLRVIAGSVENLRDITIERAALDWIDIPFMDVTHGYDAVPTVTGRPFAHYTEMLQSDLEFIKFVHGFSPHGKWADITGNYHSAVDVGVDGIKLEEEYCKDLGLNRMQAPAQTPGREFFSDIMYSLARTMETVGNVAQFVCWGRSDDVNVFSFPLGNKGSSGMPHKDAKGGNPAAEEQVESFESYMAGVLTTSLATCNMRYARDLTGTASDRVIFESGFKCADHAIRGMADVMYKLNVNKDRSEERVKRSYGIITSPRVLAYLTDPRKVKEPMARSEAHDLLGKKAAEAYNSKTPFSEVLLRTPEVTVRIPEVEIKRLTDPLGYVGESKKIIEAVYTACHWKKTF